MVKRYNAAAARVMKENNMLVNDLNAHVTPVVAKLQRAHDVHFGLEGSEFLAKQVAAEIAKSLPGKIVVRVSGHVAHSLHRGEESGDAHGGLEPPRPARIFPGQIHQAAAAEIGFQHRSHGAGEVGVGDQQRELKV
ncbi:MAG: hypothetical protein RL514_4291 [Verrucomicrobiota bacterium]